MPGYVGNASICALRAVQLIRPLSGVKEMLESDTTCKIGAELFQVGQLPDYYRLEFYRLKQ